MSDSVADRAALLVRHAVRPAARARYEAWIGEVARECRRFAGFQGTAVIRPEGSGTSYTLLVHFDSDAQLQAWVGSEQRRRLVGELRPLLLRTERLRAGAGLWFTQALAGERQPKAYKQFLVTFSAIYPLSQGVPALLRMLTDSWHLPAGAIPLLSSGLIVWLMVYVIMPRYVKAVSGWLFR